MSALATGAVAIDDAEVVRLTWELSGTRGRALLPDGLFLTTPALLTVQAIRTTVGAGGLGPFKVVTLELSCRSGARARSLTLAGAIDADEDTAERLHAGWAFPGHRTGIGFERRYDAVRITVDGLVDAEARELRPLGLHDAQFVVALHPVVVEGAARVAQVDLDVEPRRAERGRPRLHALRAGGGDGRPLQVGRPVVAVVAVGALTLPRVRFLLDPAQEPHLGTVVLA